MSSPDLLEFYATKDFSTGVCAHQPPLKRHRGSAPTPQELTSFQTEPGTTRTKRWTRTEDDRLLVAVSTLGENFAHIANRYFFGSRTEGQCRHRWVHVLSAGRKQGPFCKDEDAIIRELTRSSKDWNEVAKHVPGRTAKQVRERFTNHLDPALNNDPWTVLEDKALIKAHEQFGNSWKDISKVLPGRSENHCKNRWKSKRVQSQVSKDCVLKVEHRDGTMERCALKLPSSLQREDFLQSSHSKCSGPERLSTEQSNGDDYFPQKEDAHIGYSLEHPGADSPNSSPLASCETSSFQKLVSTAVAASSDQTSEGSSKVTGLTAGCIHELTMNSRASQAIATARIPNELGEGFYTNTSSWAGTVVEECTKASLKRPRPLLPNDHAASVSDELAHLRNENAQLKSSLMRLIAAAQVAIAPGEPPTEHTTSESMAFRDASAQLDATGEEDANA